jgi:hypothetical protein
VTTLRLDVHPAELPVLFSGIRRNQVPIAASRAMNEVAEEAYIELVSGLGQRFTLRSTRTIKSLRAIKSNKKQWPNLQSGLGVLDQWLARHEEGGVQTPERSSTFAVPTKAITRLRTRSGAIPKDLRPRELRHEGKARRRQDRIINLAKNGSLSSGTVLFLLHRRIRLPSRLEGRRTLDRVASGGLLRNFEVYLEAALRSERVRPGSFTSAQGRFFWLKALKKVTSR